MGALVENQTLALLFIAAFQGIQAVALLLARAVLSDLRSRISRLETMAMQNRTAIQNFERNGD